MTLQRFYRVFAWRGIPIFAHWSLVAFAGAALLFALDVGWPILSFAGGFVAILVAHELGHAYAARSGGCRVEAIELYPFHGRCLYLPSQYRFTEARVVWGGVAAQAVLGSLAGAARLLPFTQSIHVLDLTLWVLSYVNFSILLFNLVPIRGLDGQRAWPLLPALLAGYRRRVASRSRRRR